jgi:hypothetical protein
VFRLFAGHELAPESAGAGFDDGLFGERHNGVSFIAVDSLPSGLCFDFLVLFTVGFLFQMSK